MKRTLLATLCLAALGLPSLGQAQSVVVTVGQAQITERHTLARILTLAAQVSFHGKLTDSMMKKLRKKAVEQLVEEELLKAEAVRLGLRPSPAEVQKAVAAATKRGGGAARLRRRLAARHQSLDDFERQVRGHLAAKAVIEKLVIAPSRITKANVRAHYDANKARFFRPRTVKLRHLLFLTDPTAPVTARKKAKGLALSATAALAAGSDFDKMSSGLLDRDPKHVRYTDLGWIHEGRLAADVEKAVFRLEKGQHSQPLETVKGYLVVRCDGVRPARQLTFHESAARIETQLVTSEAERRKAALLRRLRRQHPVKRHQRERGSR